MAFVNEKKRKSTPVQQTRSFAERIKQQIREKSNNGTLQENLILGMCTIMEKYGGYTHFDFIERDFPIAQYFVLIDQINIQAKKEKEQYDKIKSKKHG